MLQGNERILIVDDDKLMSEAFGAGLSQSGYRCAIAGSPEEADRALQQEKFDLMLLDIGLPGRSGLALLPELTRRYPNMAILMVTGRDDRATAVLAMREGAYDFLSKPVPLGELTIRVEKALSRRALVLENKEYQSRLERMVQELNARLEQSKRELAALNNLAQSHVAGEETTADAYVTLESAVTVFGSGLESLANLAKDFGNAVPEFIKTGEYQLDERLGGGIPLGSLMLIEGSSSTGKSVLCQHVIFGALMAKRGTACYSSEYTSQSLLTQMYSIGLDVSQCPEGSQLSIYPLQDPISDEDSEPFLSALALSMESLPGSQELIVVDAITNLASNTRERSILSFFSSCKRMCASGRTIVLVAHSSTFDDRLLVRLRAMCDGYLSLRIENIGAKLSKILEVRKVHNAERPTGSIVYFDVEPGMGIRVNPFSRARV